MNIDARMRELIPLLAQGINGVRLEDARPSCQDEWGEDYAIINDVYWLTAADFGGDDHYFDDARFRYDLNQFILNHFKSATTEPVVMHRNEPWNHKWPVGTVVVSYRESCHELEVYRVKEEPASA